MSNPSVLLLKKMKQLRLEFAQQYFFFVKLYFQCVVMWLVPTDKAEALK